jgi:hypothetical protein
MFRRHIFCNDPSGAAQTVLSAAVGTGAALCHFLPTDCCTDSRQRRSNLDRTRLIEHAYLVGSQPRMQRVTNQKSQPPQCINGSIGVQRVTNHKSQPPQCIDGSREVSTLRHCSGRTRRAKGQTTLLRCRPNPQRSHRFVCHVSARKDGAQHRVARPLDHGRRFLTGQPVLCDCWSAHRCAQA